MSPTKPQLRGGIFAPVRPATSSAGGCTICQDNCVDPSAPANWHSGKLWLTPCNWRICVSPSPALLFCYSQCTHRNVIRLQRIRLAQSTHRPVSCQGLRATRTRFHARSSRISERGFYSSTRRFSPAQTRGFISCFCATCSQDHIRAACGGATRIACTGVRRVACDSRYRAASDELWAIAVGAIQTSKACRPRRRLAGRSSKHVGARRIHPAPPDRDPAFH